MTACGILHPRYNVHMHEEVRGRWSSLLSRWVTPLFTLAAVGLVPWTLWLTFALPSRQLTEHYDLAWVGFDVALAAAFAATAWAAVTGSQWLVAIAAVTGTMLVCDAWFDVVTSIGGGDEIEAILQAVLVELPFAGVCALIVYDSERFLGATVWRFVRQPS